MNQVETRICKTFKTKDTNGEINGEVVELKKFGNKTSAYLTICSPGRCKGIHYHDRHTMYFYCVKGSGEIMIDYKEVYKIDGAVYTEVKIPVNKGILITNTGCFDLVILSLPSPMWDGEGYVSKTEDPITREAK